MKIVVSRMSEQAVEQLRQVAAGHEVVWANTDEELRGHFPDADVYIGYEPTDIIQLGTRLRWIQSMSVGVDHLLFPEMIEGDTIITNTRGPRNPVMAEHAFTFVLAFSRNLHTFIRQQLRKAWVKQPVGDLRGQTLGVVGFGNIGREVGLRGSQFGMRVLAVDRAEMPAPEWAAGVWQNDRLHEMLAQADYVVVVLPLTPETQHLIGRAEFAVMKRTAYFINIGRGPVVDETALIEALRSGLIAGAGLDTMEVEPLPPESPLWEMEQVIITPHLGGAYPAHDRDMVAIYCENLRRFLAGEPLLYTVDKRRGY